MPQFNARFTREVIEKDEWFETIEADTLADAEAKAGEIADEMDNSCPDGVQQVGGAEIGDWGVEYVLPGPADAAWSATAEPATADQMHHCHSELDEIIGMLKERKDDIQVPSVRQAVEMALHGISATLDEADRSVTRAEG